MIKFLIIAILAWYIVKTAYRLVVSSVVDEIARGKREGLPFENPVASPGNGRGFAGEANRPDRHSVHTTPARHGNTPDIEDARWVEITD